MGSKISAPLTGTGDPQGSVLNPVLYSYTPTTTQGSNTVIKFADDTLMETRRPTGARSTAWLSTARTITSLSTPMKPRSLW